MKCGSCKDHHPTASDVRDCYTSARGGYLSLEDAAAEQAGEIYAEAVMSWVAGGGSPADAPRYAAVVARGGTWDGGIGDESPMTGETCEHGLDAGLCEGPQHYPMDM